MQKNGKKVIIFIFQNSHIHSMNVIMFTLNRDFVRLSRSKGRIRFAGRDDTLVISDTGERVYVLFVLEGLIHLVLIG